MKLNVKILAAIVVIIAIAGLAWVYLKDDASIVPQTANEVTNEVTTGEMENADSSVGLYTPGKITDHVMGNVDAKVTIVEYASLTCPHCANFHVNTFKKFKTDYIDTGKVKFIYRNFHLDTLALAGAMLAQCAPEDQYFTIIDLIFSNQQKWIRAENQFEAMVNVLKLVGYTNDKVNECLAKKDITGDLLDDRQTAADDYGVNSTPTLFINGEKTAGVQDYAALAAKVDGLLAE